MDDEGPLNCIRCETQLTFVGDKDFHEGSRGWGFFLGDTGELFTNRERVEMYACEACGHIEFFCPSAARAVLEGYEHRNATAPSGPSRRGRTQIGTV